MSYIIKVYSYPLCNTCRKAIKWLNDNRIAHEILDITKSPPEKEFLIKAIDQVQNRKSLFNTSGLSYRKLGASKINDMNDNKAIKALGNDPKLIKRPFVVIPEGPILLGFKIKNWEETLLE